MNSMPEKIHFTRGSKLKLADELLVAFIRDHEQGEPEIGDDCASGRDIGLELPQGCTVCGFDLFYVRGESVPHALIESFASYSATESDQGFSWASAYGRRVKSSQQERRHMPSADPVKATALRGFVKTGDALGMSVDTTKRREIHMDSTESIFSADVASFVRTGDVLGFAGCLERPDYSLVLTCKSTGSALLMRERQLLVACQSRPELYYARPANGSSLRAASVVWHRWTLPVRNRQILYRTIAQLCQSGYVSGVHLQECLPAQLGLGWSSRDVKKYFVPVPTNPSPQASLLSEQQG
jgi:hypothetical protein